jgi:omega-6 fatty acid desaturase (delta-12 desaturase)
MIAAGGHIEQVSVVTDRAQSERSWRQQLVPYTEPRLGRSAVDIATSVVPYLGLLTAIYFSLRVSIVLALVLAIPSAGFLIRTFIVFHDCAHGSFLRSRRSNDALGAVLGLLVWLPFQGWRREHAIHHATSGDLDRRGIGDIKTLTIAEYRAQPWWSRSAYRLFRNPFVMFGLGWILVLVLKPRFVPRSAHRRIRHSVLGTDLALALLVGGLCLVLGWRSYLEMQVPTLILAGAAGIWLFYVQHQFEDAYWETNDEWSYDDAALRGSSYLKLPRILQFFTGNIGFHHVHHLSAQIPNYRLQSAHDESARLRATPALSLREALRATRLKLWDEEQRRLVTFGHANRTSRAQA